MLETGPVSLGHADELPDDVIGEGERQRLQHVDIALQAVQEPVDRLRDRRSQGCHPVGGERPGHQPTEAAVLGRVGEQHAVAASIEERFAKLRVSPVRGPGLDWPAHQTAPEVRIVQGGGAVVVAGKDEHASDALKDGCGGRSCS